MSICFDTRVADKEWVCTAFFVKILFQRIGLYRILAKRWFPGMFGILLISNTRVSLEEDQERTCDRGMLLPRWMTPARYRGLPDGECLG